jgi:hypothetical protein
MRPGFKTVLGATLIAPGLILTTLAINPIRGDEPGSRLGRLFRFGNNSSSSPSAIPTNPGPEYTAPVSSPPVTTPATPGASPRLVPQPRVSRSVTEADPILTRIALARSNDGNSFGMFLQIFADGTVLDSEGVHHLSPSDLKPVIEAIQASELHRLKGHCGAPATDFIEQVHMVIFDRSYGRLRANSFSYSGNPQGCDHAVRHLHQTLENLQAKLSRPMPGTSPVPATPDPVPANPPTPAVTIPLTPAN